MCAPLFSWRCEDTVLVSMTLPSMSVLLPRTSEEFTWKLPVAVATPINAFEAVKLWTEQTNTAANDARIFKLKYIIVMLLTFSFKVYYAQISAKSKEIKDLFASVIPKVILEAPG
jgi:hypothetical protein